MKFDELKREVSRQTGLPQSSVEQTLRTTVELIQSEISDDREVRIPGLGKFYRRFKDSRTGRNPNTGEEIIIAGRHYPAFRPSKGLKESAAPGPQAA
jgi:DNA-binding protein HU-beta